MSKVKQFLIAFDFDHTIVDENSDIVVKDLLPKHAITDKLESLRTVNGWTDYMEGVFSLLYEFGVSEQEIAGCVQAIAPAPGVVQLFQYLNTACCEVIIISDSNTYFIDEWLKKQHLKSSVSKVYSNPAHFKSGKLYIEKYHVQDWCALSSVNLCKGHILEEHLQTRRHQGVDFKFVAYVGDGQNDVCPSRRLTDVDVVFARSGMRLDTILRNSADSIRAQLFSWENAESIVECLKDRCSEE